VQGGGSDDHYGEEDVEDMEKFVLFFAEEEGSSEEDDYKQVSRGCDYQTIFWCRNLNMRVVEEHYAPKRYTRDLGKLSKD
jgi:hypothetical protein